MHPKSTFVPGNRSSWQCEELCPISTPGLAHLAEVFPGTGPSLPTSVSSSHDVLELFFCLILQCIVPENLSVCENVLRVCFVLLTCLHLKRSIVRFQQAAGEQHNKHSLLSCPCVLFLPTKHPNTNTQIPLRPHEAARHRAG